jgi:hypothetical protein
MLGFERGEIVVIETDLEATLRASVIAEGLPG